MREFENVKWLLLRLTQNERRLLFRNIDSLTDLSKKEESLTLKLVKLIYNDPILKSEEAQLKIYKLKNHSAFRKLIQRLEEKLHDLLLHHESLVNNIHYDPRSMDILILRKKLLQFDMLWMRGSTEKNLKQLDRIIEKANFYEYYEILLFALYKKRRLLSYQLSSAQYESLCKRIEEVEFKRKALIEAEEYLNQLANRRENNLLASKSRIEILREYKNILENYIQKCNSLNIEYYYRYIKLEYLDQMNDIVSAAEDASNLVIFLANNPAVKSGWRYENAILNLISFEIRVYNFVKARTLLKEVGRVLTKHFYNNFLLKEIIFYLNLYTVDANGTKRNIDQLSEITEQLNDSNIFKRKFYFLNTIYNYIYKPHEKINGLLSGINFGDFPDEKWKFSHRVFNILLLIEAEKYELADAQIENNRKYIERMKKSDVLNPRQSLIGKVLVELSRKSYDFKKVSKSKHKELTLLDSVEPEYRWQILSPEFIVFQEWFNAQLNHEKYDHGKVMERMKAKISPVVQKPLVTLKPDDGSKYNRRVPSGAKRKKLATA